MAAVNITGKGGKLNPPTITINGKEITLKAPTMKTVRVIEDIGASTKSEDVLALVAQAWGVDAKDIEDNLTVDELTEAAIYASSYVNWLIGEQSSNAAEKVKNLLAAKA